MSGPDEQAPKSSRSGAIQAENALNPPDVLKAALMLAAIEREPRWTIVEPFCGAYVHPRGRAAVRTLALAREIDVRAAAPDGRLHELLRTWDLVDLAPGGLALQDRAARTIGPLRARLADADAEVIASLPDSLRAIARCAPAAQSLDALLSAAHDEPGVLLRLDAYNAAGDLARARARELGGEAPGRVAGFMRVELIFRAVELIEERSALVQVFAIRDRMMDCFPLLDVVEALGRVRDSVTAIDVSAGMVMLTEPPCWDLRARRITGIGLVGLGRGAALAQELLSVSWEDSFVTRGGLGDVASYTIDGARRELRRAAEAATR